MAGGLTGPAVRVAVTMPTFAAGGAERVSLELVEGLVDRGVDVDVVVGVDEGGLRGSVPSRARTFVLGQRRVAASLPRLVRYLRSERPDALISCLDHLNVVSIAAARLVRPRVWVMATEHNTLSTKAQHAATRRDWLMPALVAIAYRAADRIVAVSDGVADDLARTTRLPRHRIQTVYNPVDFERVLAAASEPADHPWLVPGTGPVVLAAGRLIAQKDFATLVRAVALLPDEFRLILLGDGPERAPLEALVAELGLSERVDVHGFVPNPYPYFRAADVFVLSSRWEGLPTVLIEALAFDAPIVATDCRSGPREILSGGRWGHLVPVGEPGAMAATIAEAVASPPRRAARALDPYRLGSVTQRYLDLLPLAEPEGASR